MTAMDLLARLRRCGFDLKLRDGAVVVSPASQLAEADRDLLRLHKPALLLLLEGKGPEAAQRLYYCPDPERAKEWRGGKRVGQRPRWYTWEGAPGWFRVSPPGEGGAS